MMIGVIASLIQLSLISTNGTDLARAYDSVEHSLKNPSDNLEMEGNFVIFIIDAFFQIFQKNLEQLICVR